MRWYDIYWYDIYDIFIYWYDIYMYDGRGSNLGPNTRNDFNLDTSLQFCCQIVDNIPIFPKLSEFYNSDKNWQTYCPSNALHADADEDSIVETV